MAWAVDIMAEVGQVVPAEVYPLAAARAAERAAYNVSKPCESPVGRAPAGGTAWPQAGVHAAAQEAVSRGLAVELVAAQTVWGA